MKKRVSQLPAYPTSIASLDFSADGSLLAVASSYTHEEGDKECVCCGSVCCVRGCLCVCDKFDFVCSLVVDLGSL